MNHPRAITFELITSTALFSHGSNPKGDAEVRAPPFEALARYFFRALVGDRLSAPCGGATATCTCLRCEEGRVFGSADHGKSVALVVEGNASNRGTCNLLPHQNSSPSSAVVPEQELFLQLMPALPTTRDENLKAAGATLLVGLLLGGIGQRSRRGAGSLRIKSLKGPIGIDISAFQQASSVKDYAKALETVLRDAKNMALASVCPLPHQAAGGTFPMLTKKSAGIMLMEFDAKSESDARAEVMFKLRRHKNAAFGLPYLKPAQGDNEKRGRHASPLWIRLAPFHKRWLATLTVMKSGTLAGNPGKLDKYLDDIHTRHGGISVAIP